MQNATLDGVQDCVDAMAQAVRDCKTNEWTEGEMWLEIEAQCQRLNALANADENDEDDEEDEDTDVEEINFDDEDENDVFADDEEYH